MITINNHISFYIENMNHKNCTEGLTSALNNLNGVYNVILDMDSSHIAVEYDEERLDISTIKGTIEDVGYKVR